MRFQERVSDSGSVVTVTVLGGSVGLSGATTDMIHKSTTHRMTQKV